MGVPAKRPPTWHWAQVTVRWAPARGKRVLLWSKVAGRQALVVWQLLHVVGKAAAVWLGDVVAW